MLTANEVALQVTKALDMLWDNAKVTDAEEKAEETTEA